MTEVIRRGNKNSSDLSFESYLNSNVYAMTGDHLNKGLMKYVPKDFKPYVEDIREGAKEYDERKRKWNTPILVTWQNGKKDIFTNKTWMRFVLEDQYWPEEFKE